MKPTDFSQLVHTIGDRQDYFQGTGGNISWKVSDYEMHIKASGMRVRDMMDPAAIVPVNHGAIRNFFKLDNEKNKESHSTLLTMDSVLENTSARPSMETGFHTLLDKAVIHSHSVYANLLACSKEFEENVMLIFADSDISYVTVPYTPPGYFLTHKILEGMKIIDNPQVIFMKNHGLIVSAASLEEAINLHEKINGAIMRYFSILEPYPQAKLYHLETGESVSATPYLQEFFQNHKDYLLDIKNRMLFPDLIVFCNELVFSEEERTEKIVINPDSGAIRYNTGKKEAHIIEENLIAWAYLISMMKRYHLTPNFISEEEGSAVLNMEAEEYRKKMVI